MNDDKEFSTLAEALDACKAENADLERRVRDLTKQRDMSIETLQVIEALLIEVMAHFPAQRELVGMMALIKRYTVQQVREIDASDIPF